VNTVTIPDTKVADEYAGKLTGKTILISGASGYLGTAMLNALRSVQCRVVGLSHDTDCVADPFECEATITTHQIDLSRAGVWPSVLEQVRPDLIIHLAAFEHRRGSEHLAFADLAINASTVLELLESCRELGLSPRVVLASSANLVGCPDKTLVDEQTPDQPLTLYAIHKLAAEQYLALYAQKFDMPTTTLRFANVYGPLVGDTRVLESRVVLNRMMLRALDGGPLNVYRNQDCLRDFVYVDDVVRALCAASTYDAIKPGRKYVIGSGEGHALKDIVSLIGDRVVYLGRARPEVVLDSEAQLDAIEWRQFVANSSRMREATGWRARVSLQEGIDRSLQSFVGGHIA
jgi:nucleoside-diphosphate-sugar epimerase